METQTGQQATFSVNGWLPNGMKVYFTVPMGNGVSAFDQALIFTNGLLEKGFMQTEPGLGRGEHTELIGSVARREKVNKDGTTSTVLDLYAAAQHLTFRYMAVYLDTPEDVQAFENASGLKIDKMPLNPTDSAPGKDNAKLVVRAPKPLTVVYTNNPDYDEASETKKPKRLFVRWDVQSNVLPLETPANAPQSHQEAATADLSRAAGDYEPRTPKQALNGNGPAERTVTANTQAPANGKQGYKDGDLMNAVLKTVYGNNPIHMKKSLKKLNDEGKLGPWLTLDEAVEVVKNRHADETKDIPA